MDLSHDEFAKSAVGTIWTHEWPIDVGDDLYLVVGYDTWERSVTVLNLCTGVVEPCPFDSRQRARVDHWAIFVPVPRKGLWSLVRVNL